MMSPILRASVAVLFAAPALVTGALAQESEGSGDMMSVYVGSAAGGSEEGTTVELSLEDAAEACGVDLEIIQAWAEGEPRYCVALETTAAVEEAMANAAPAEDEAAPAGADEPAPAEDEAMPADEEAAPADENTAPDDQASSPGEEDTDPAAEDGDAN